MIYSFESMGVKVMISMPTIGDSNLEELGMAQKLLEEAQRFIDMKEATLYKSMYGVSKKQKEELTCLK